MARTRAAVVGGGSRVRRRGRRGAGVGHVRAGPPVADGVVAGGGRTRPRRAGTARRAGPVGRTGPHRAEMHDVLAHRISLVSMHAGALELRLESSADEEVVRSAETIRAARTRRWRTCATSSASCASSPPARPRARSPRWPTCPSSWPRSSRREPPSSSTCRSPTPRPCPKPWAHGVPGRPGGSDERPQARARHSAHVLVDGRRGRSLRVVVRDSPDGSVLRGRGSAPASGFGLVGLRERVELVGGTVRAHRVGDGFEVSAKLPWPRR